MALAYHPYVAHDVAPTVFRAVVCARGEFCYVQNLVDEAEQAFLVTDDVLGIPVVGAFCRRALKYMVRSRMDDGQRSAELVGDVSEE